MKTTFLLTGLFHCLSTFSQVGFTKVVDPTNPVTTFVSSGIYKGAAWVDVDNDGKTDLFAGQNFLFKNNGLGSFSQSTTAINANYLQFPSGASWGDLDNDGDLDCITAQNPSGVYTNNGSGVFTNISAQIPGFSGFTAWGCAIGDWNKDAYPDFLFAHAMNFPSGYPATPCNIYLNKNNSIISAKITGYAFTDSVRPYTVPIWSDFDLDGDMDLFIASGPVFNAGYDYCYKNLKIETGLDTLERLTTPLFASQLQDGQCYNFVDIDNDGDLDVCLTNYSKAPTRLYLNTGGVYTSISTPFTIIGAGHLANNWGDFDNDGDLDVIITNDSGPASFYKNNGSGNFTLATSNLSQAGNAGIANCDYDNDGDLDVFIHGSGNARVLLRNDSVATGSNWVNFKCKGTLSNSTGLGAILKIVTTVGLVQIRQIREINAQNSFNSMNDLRVHFGLGGAAQIDSLIIKWPSGLVEVCTNMQANNFYTMVEGACISTVGIKENKNALTDFQIYPNPASDEIWLKYELKESSKLRFSVFDLQGRQIELCEEPQQSVGIYTKKLATKDYQPGMYFLKISVKNSYMIKKFILK